MTMHLLPIYYNNNSTKKKKPFRKAGWQKAQAEHDKWLMSRGVHLSQLKNKIKIQESRLLITRSIHGLYQQAITQVKLLVSQKQMPTLARSLQVSPLCINQTWYLLIKMLMLKSTQP